MLSRLGRLTVARRRLVLSLTVLFMVVAGVLGGAAFGVLQEGGFEVAGSESARADALIEDHFAEDEPNVVLVVTGTDGDVDSAAATSSASELLEQVRSIEHVDAASSYWELGAPPPLRSTDGTRALVLVVADESDDHLDSAIHDLRELAERPPPGLEIAVGGSAPVGVDIRDTIESDLARAELIAIPITLLLLLLVFRGLVAASLPLFVGMIAIFGTLLSLFVIGSITDVSIFAVNLTTALGLGLAVDYSLFIVSRYREELAKGLEVGEAVVRAVETAGKTVVISALTVAVSLSALLVFPQYFLRSFAYAGIAVVLLALAASTVSLPALLAVVGRRIDSIPVFPHRPVRAEHEGFWYRTARRVMRRPATVAAGVVAVLLLLGAPFLGVRFGRPDDRVLPEDAPSRVANEQVRDAFDGNAAESFPVVIPDVADDETEVLSRFVADVSALAGVDRVDQVTDGGFARLTVVPDIEVLSPEGERLVQDIRDVETSLDVAVGGQTAELIDTKASIAERLPIALALVVVTTAALLFLLTGSILVPIKALVLSALSLTATYGAMVWIFQDGNLADPLGFSATGYIDTTMPILMFCIAFGLSMDYEVFMLSRIKEEHDRTRDNDEAVALGLERTGRIVTAAALILSVTFFAFATSGVSFIILFGLGLGIAVLMDAFVIRGLLVPAFMKLAGEANWWAPAPLRRIHQRFGIDEGAD